MDSVYVGNDPNIASVVLSDDYTNPRSKIAASTKCVYDAFTDATRTATNNAYGVIAPDNVTTNVIDGKINVVLSDSVTEADPWRVPSRNAVKIAYDKGVEALNQANNALNKALYAISGQRRYVANVASNITLDKDYHLNRILAFTGGGYNIYVPVGNSFGNGWYCTLANYSNSNITLIASGCTIYGNNILDAQTSMDIVSNGVNWFTLDTSGRITQ